MLTRDFKSGNSLAVRIPKELAFVDDLTPILTLFSPDFMAGGREFHEQQERDWSGNHPPSVYAGRKVGVDKAPG